MLGVISGLPERVAQIIEGARADGKGSLEARSVEAGDAVLGLLVETGPGSREGFHHSEDCGACAVIRGGIGANGDIVSGSSAASLLLQVESGEVAPPPDELSGLFVGALWNPQDRSLMLLSDWIGGIHQLYYAQLEDAFVFGTDARMLVGCGAWQGTVDRVGLTQYLDFGHTLPPNTIFSGIRRLPAGCEAIYRDGQIDLHRRLSLHFGRDAGNDSAARLREAHRNAVARCMSSIEDVGAFLSGGIDSSLNVAVMREISDAPFSTFCVSYPGEGIDESDYARLVADRFNTDHHELALKSAAVLDELPEMIWALEEPAMDYSFIPTFKLASFARRHVWAVISGDGPDHLFGRHYPVALIRNTFGRVPGVRGLATASMSGPTRTPQASRLWRRLRRRRSGRLLWKVLQSVAGDSAQAYLSIYREIACRGIMPEHALSLLADPEQIIPGEDWLDLSMMTDCGDGHLSEFERLIALDLAIDGSCGVFAKVGKMARYHDLVVQEPFLDPEVRDLVEGLPTHLKATGCVRELVRGRLRRKVLLYEAALGVLPDEVLAKPKQGFRAPIASWLREWISDLDAAELLPSLTGDTGLLHEAKVNALLREHACGGCDHDTLIMMLITLDLWYAIFVIGKARKPDWGWSDYLKAHHK